MYISNKYNTGRNTQNSNPSFGVKINNVSFYELISNRSVPGNKRIKFSSIGKLINIKSKDIIALDEVSLEKLIKKIGFHILNLNPKYNTELLRFDTALKNNKGMDFIKKIHKYEQRMREVSLNEDIQKSIRQEFGLMQPIEKKRSYIA